MRALALRALTVAVGLVIASAIAEIALRLLTGPPAAPKFVLSGSSRSASLFPDFRNRSFRPEKAPGTFRIVTLGDSYTWGWRVDPSRTYAPRLEKWLAQTESGYRYEVVPWSRPGWNTWSEWLSIRDRLGDWDPDLLIVGFVLNDAEPTDLGDRELIRQDLVRRSPGGVVGSRLYRHSRLASRLYDAVENRRMRRTLTTYYHGLFEGAGWDQAKRGLRRLRDAAGKLDIPLLLVIFPIFDSQLDDGYAYGELHDLVSQTARKLKIPCLDLLPFYAGIDGRKLSVDPFMDAHPSALAHRVATAEILKYLEREGLLPDRSDA